MRISSATTLTRVKKYDEIQLKEDLIDSRIINNNLILDNKKIKTQLTVLQVIIHHIYIKTISQRQFQRYEDQQLSNMMSDQFQITKQVKPSIVPSLKTQIRDYAQQNESLKEQLKQYQKQVQGTKITELEYTVSQLRAENQLIQSELQNLIQVDQGDHLQQGRVQACLNKIQSLNEENMKCREMYKKQEKQSLLVQLEIKKMKEQNQQTLSEKGSIQRRLYDQIKDLREQLEEEQNKYKTLEISASVAGIENLKINIQNAQAQLQQLTLQSKTTQKEHQDKINSYLDQISTMNQNIIDKDDIISQAQSNIDYLAKQIDSKTRSNSNKIVLGTSRIQRVETGTQFPTYMPDNRIITKEDLKIITSQLKYSLKRRGVNQRDIPRWLFDEINNQQEISFKYIFLRLQKFPFSLSSYESFSIAQYIISPEQSDLFKNEQVFEEISEGVLASRVIHIVDTYEIMNYKEEYQMQSEISKLFNKQHRALEQAIFQTKKIEKCELNMNFCTQKTFISAILQILDMRLSTKQLDYIQQMSWEQYNDPININYILTLKIFNATNNNTITQRLSQCDKIVSSSVKTAKLNAIPLISTESINVRSLNIYQIPSFNYQKKAKMPNLKKIKLTPFQYKPYIKIRLLMKEKLDKFEYHPSIIRKEKSQIDLFNQFQQTDKISLTYHKLQTHIKRSIKSIVQKSCQTDKMIQNNQKSQTQSIIQQNTSSQTELFKNEFEKDHQNYQVQQNLSQQSITNKHETTVVVQEYLNDLFEKSFCEVERIQTMPDNQDDNENEKMMVLKSLEDQDIFNLNQQQFTNKNESSVVVQEYLDDLFEKSFCEVQRIQTMPDNQDDNEEKHMIILSKSHEDQGIHFAQECLNDLLEKSVEIIPKNRDNNIVLESPVDQEKQIDDRNALQIEDF